GIETKKHVTGLDFTLLYFNLIMTYSIFLEKMILTNKECVRHNNQFEKKDLYPVVLEDLFNKRVELKVQLVSL
ncbi:6017_t:CDS:2, partial [Funneliformis geosporum]